MNKVCQLCYREFSEEQMKGDYCWTCFRIIGKGPGYKDTISDEEAEKWLEGWEKRKKEFEKK
jgi:hypothetical protein